MEITKETKIFCIKFTIILALMLIIGKLPPIFSITSYGMQVLGIFVGCIVGWGFGYVGTTSILGLLLLSFTGENTITTIFSSAYGNANVIITLFAFLFANGINQTGIMEHIAKFVLTRKFATKNLWNISLAFWIAGIICTALVTLPLPVTILMWSIFYSVVEKLGISKKNKWVQITLVMEAGICYTAGVIMPYSLWPLMCYGVASSSIPDFEMNLFAHTLVMVIINIVLLLLVFSFCKFVLGKNLSMPIQIESILDKNYMKKMGKRQKFGIFYLLLLAIVIFLPNLMPKTIPIINFFSNLGTIGAFALLIVLLSITHVEGKPLMDIIEAMKNMSWSLYLLLATALVFADMITKPEIGISATIVELLSSHLVGFSITTIVVLFITIGLLVTNAVNNVVCMNIFIPIGVSLMASLGGNIGALTCLLSLILYLGIILPSGSATGALLHGNTEYLEAKKIYEYASLFCLFTLIVCLFVGIPLSNLMF